jgi:hypothetical protein
VAIAKTSGEASALAAASHVVSTVPVYAAGNSRTQDAVRTEIDPSVNVRGEPSITTDRDPFVSVAMSAPLLSRTSVLVGDLAFV